MLRFSIMAAVLLTACGPYTPPPPNMCQQAKTYGAMFGTPEKKGPCWGRTLSVSQMGNIRSYVVQMRLPGYVLGTVTYQGDTLVQAGVSS
ncbi:hypothetical protein [Sulfitobacter sp.]|uniref:hypothetical protein n=1 Tax=Sulfitobacter sp. TaxID=1903071 RepID=UPI003F6AECA4